MGWAYTKRQDGKMAVTVDSNVWNFLYDRQIDLADALPSEAFALFIPREVEIEGEALASRSDKNALRDYIKSTIEACSIKTTMVFGFGDFSPGPQRRGFGGHFQSATEREFYDAIRQRFLLGKPQRKSQLSHNEGDAAVAAQSFFSIVLTNESPTKEGPIQFAADNGGKVLYLTDFDKSGASLREFIERCYRQI